MPLYRYEALDRSGNRVVGAMQVNDEAALNTRLLAMGYRPILVQVASNGGRNGRAAARSPAAPGKQPASGGVEDSRITAGERAVARMYHQLFISFRAGMPAFQVLHTVSGQVADAQLRQMLYEMALAIRDGNTLSAQMERYPRVFRAGDVGIVRAGEVAGCLPEAFEALAQRYEQEDNARRRLGVFAGFFHVSLFAFFLIIALIWGLRAMIQALTGSATTGADFLGSSLPAIGQALLWFTLPCSLLYGGLLFGLSRLRRSPEKAYAWHRFLLRLPVLGKINRLRSTAVFTRTLQWLYHAGQLPANAWEDAARAVPNLYLAERFMLGKPAVESSARMSVGMQQTGLLDVADVGMVATGESTGDIPGALRYLADRYEEEVRSAITAGVTRASISFVAWALMLTPMVVGFLYWCYGSAILQISFE